MQEVLSSQMKRSPGVLVQRVKSDAPTTVLLNPKNGQYYTLDEIGGRIWELCDGTRKVSDIVALITQEYEAPSDVIEADVVALLTDLADEQLVSRHP